MSVPFFSLNIKDFTNYSNAAFKCAYTRLIPEIFSR